MVLRSYAEAGHVFTDDDARLAALFADQAAAAMENARLYSGLTTQVERLHEMTRLNQVISSTLDRTSVLEEIARAASTLFAWPVVSFWVLDEANGQLRASGADRDDGNPLRRNVAVVGEGLVGWVAQHRRPLAVDDAVNDPRNSNPAWWRSNDLRSYYGVPVMHEGTLLAVLR